MGLSYTLYVGAYLVCKNSKVKHTTDYTSCPNKLCLQHKTELQTAFCATCGSKVDLLTRFTFSDKVKTRDVVDAIKERLVEVSQKLNRDASPDLWVSNLSNCNSNVSYDTHYSSFVSEFTEEEIKSNLENFKTFFAKDIVKIEEAYGKENVTLKWGVVHHIY